MTHQNKSNYLAKIKKLLALAAKTTNPNEAANAMRQAQNLMRAHQISQNDVTFSSVDETLAKPKLSKTPTRYLAYLISLISGVFSVKAIYVANFSGANVRFIGVEGKSEIAAYVFDVLFRQLSKARKEFQATQSKRLKRTTLIARSDQFCLGWVQGAARHIQLLEMDEAEKNLLEAYVENRFKEGLNTVKTRDEKEVNGSHNARHAGYLQGRHAQLNQGVRGEEQLKLSGV